MPSVSASPTNVNPGDTVRFSVGGLRQPKDYEACVKEVGSGNQVAQVQVTVDGEEVGLQGDSGIDYYLEVVEVASGASAGSLTEPSEGEFDWVAP